MNRENLIALYATKGNRTQKHCLVLYLNANRDWSSIQLSRNGHDSLPLATAPMTQGALDHCHARMRACSLQYSGRGVANESGMVVDLDAFGFSKDVIDQFVAAAKPYWPKSDK
jgi:hypothetical protein